MGRISKVAQCDRERKTLFWGGSRQGSRGGNIRSRCRGASGAQEGEQAQAGGNTAKGSGGNTAKGAGGNTAKGAGGNTAKGAGGSETRECLPAGRAQDAGTLMGTEAGWEMGFVEKWSLATAWRVREPGGGKAGKTAGQ